MLPVFAVARVFVVSNMYVLIGVCSLCLWLRLLVFQLKKVVFVILCLPTTKAKDSFSSVESTKISRSCS